MREIPEAYYQALEDAADALAMLTEESLSHYSLAKARHALRRVDSRMPDSIRCERDLL
jgi:hypothetical protein